MMTIMNEPQRPPGDRTRRTTDEIKAEARRTADTARDAARVSRRNASLSREIAATTREAIRLAVAEAREALKDTSVEIRVGRLTREESRQRTRELLLDAAAEVFSRLGYHGASLEAVAEAAGFTKGAVYSNFATKGELFAALLRRSSDQRVEGQIDALGSISIAQLADLSGPMLQEQAREQSTWDILQVEFWLAAMRDPALKRLMCEGTDELYDRMGTVIAEKLEEEGVTSRFSGAELARLVNALGTGLLIQVYLDPDSVDPTLFGRAIRAMASLPPADPPGEAD
jgi:AcrR family transcriptional regulator